MTGDTSLIIASEKGHEEIVKILLSNNADVSVQNKSEETALCVAKENGYNVIAWRLTQAGAGGESENEDSEEYGENHDWWPVEDVEGDGAGQEESDKLNAQVGGE